jgi:hypothetical protein
METRDIHLRAGYPSLFAYCRDVLALSEAEAYNRIEAARAARRFPVILRLLSEGAIHLTTVRLLGPHLTPGNHLQVLDSARGKRKVEVESIVAALAPRPDVPASVRKLPRPGPAVSAAPSVREPSAPAKGSVPVEPAPAARPASPESPTRRPVDVRPVPRVVEPLAPERYRLQVTIGVETQLRCRRHNGYEARMYFGRDGGPPDHSRPLGTGDGFGSRGAATRPGTSTVAAQRPPSG